MTCHRSLHPDPRRGRRGNAMILVAGILVLLVIVATAYITRTQGGRETARAVQRMETRDNNAEVIADLLASEVSSALFAEPIDPNPVIPFWSVGVANANASRLPPSAASVRYSIDRDFDNNGLPDYPYNFAPSQVVPFTNWPDENGGGVNSSWPIGPGAPGGVTDLGEFNPLGQPGTGDTRWLRDLEPLRYDTTAYTAGQPGNFIPDAFKYWRHMTHIGRANNGWRIIRDMSDVFDGWPPPNGNGVGGIQWNLNVPSEQWLTPFEFQPDPAYFNPITGDADFSVLFTDDFLTGTPFGGNGVLDFIDLWQLRLTNAPDDGTPGTFDFVETYSNPVLTPPNFYHLKDLDADGIYLENGERPSDQYVGPNAVWPFGSPRWNVGRVLADADGDGFTDSFWWLAPTPVENGIRQAVAISIVDNSARVDFSSATRFAAGRPTLNTPAQYDVATFGETPADIALFGEPSSVADPDPNANWNVGFLDAQSNWERWIDVPVGTPPNVQYPLYADGPNDNDLELEWRLNLAARNSLLTALGATDHPDFEGPPPAEDLEAPRHRRIYWLSSASRPLDPLHGFTPFSIPDEIELRMYEGQNYPWILSRFENALGFQTSTSNYFRTTLDFEESTPYLNQLNNPELMHDPRHKSTVFSGVRNDLLPSWLWWRWDIPADIQALAQGNNVDVIGNFLYQSRRKLDLRERHPDDLGLLPDGWLYFHQRLPLMLLTALTDGDENGNLYTPGSAAHSYLGDYTGGGSDRDDIRRLAAAFSANILAYRDRDYDAPLDDDITTPRLEIGAVPLPEWGLLPADLQTRFLGIERQPFLTEVFVGHLYETYTIPPGYANSGTQIILDDAPGETLYQSTIAIVQLANPFDQPVVLASENPNFPFDYQLKLFGNAPISLSEIARAIGPRADVDGDGFDDYYLPPARDDWPATMILYAMEEPPGSGVSGGWRNFFDLEPGDHPEFTDVPPVDPGYPTGTILVDLRHDPDVAGVVSPWSTNRDNYDAGAGGGVDDSVSLMRVDLRWNTPAEVVIDRIDEQGEPRLYTTEVTGMHLASERPQTYSDLGTIPQPFQDPPVRHPIGDSPSGLQDTHWMQWRSACRAWGFDVNGNGRTDPSEFNPRYISALKVLRKPENPPPGQTPLDPRTNVYRNGNHFSLTDDPELTYATGDPDHPYLPWFTIEHYPAGNLPAYARKPTYFDMNHANDPAGQPPPGGWSYPDKGYYHSPHSLQMLQKDGDFQQVGELLNVWLYGHELSVTQSSPTEITVETEKTFSEFIKDAGVALNPQINRLEYGESVGTIQATPFTPDYPYDPMHAVPEMPAALRLFDAFVCDGPGYNYNPGAPNFDPPDLFFRNAAGFTGRPTYGMINLNTAPPEVLRCLPHWYKLIHWSPEWSSIMKERFPRSAIAESLINYRERFDGNYDTANGYEGLEFGIAGSPSYFDRNTILSSANQDVRGDRGLASIGEVLLLTKDPTFVPPWGYTSASSIAPHDFRIYPDAWKIDFAADDPFEQILEEGSSNPDDYRYGAFLSTDVVRTPWERRVAPPSGDISVDGVAGDAEERNLLFAGASNLVTTGSDMFTVHFKIRSFRRNPNTGVWDATDPEYIVDESRYVMLVDRSNVNRPTDKPKIVYLEKLPN